MKQNYVSFTFSLVLDSDKYVAHPNKRLTNVIKTLVTSSKLACMKLCSTTDGCLAVNVIGNHDITCALTTGLSKENEMEDDSASKLFVLGKMNNDPNCKSKMHKATNKK